MNIERAELLRTWVAALRSGQYRQVRHVMTDEQGGFCAIGVLCDVGGADWQRFFSFCLRQEVRVAEVEALCALAGIAFSSFEFPADMNDRGASFNEIADAIERRNPDVFGEAVIPEPREALVSA